MRVFIGLGNPGPRYALTRHNVGFLFIDEMLKKCRIMEIQKTELYQAYIGDFHNCKDVLLVKPLTYMNLSGIAVKKICQDFAIDSMNEIIVVYDDIWLPLGKIRIRKNGGDGGHNGIKSIIEETNTLEFPRLRIGIGPKPESDLVNYVLGEFSDDELNLLWKVLKVSLEAAKDLCVSDILKVMSRYNSLEVN
ncbi:peptidyl-tRNA hydrolase [Kosmotoga arenicorallina S304]|uniref:Peptidyl-tRNA hydrolase n=1 Tax=Kosmotoga arenicorallina S304 TaxID=1453497 RepID=A0A176K0J6_9BACT|nr:aminoacyl-tRNA hydrolase [Kosmotoga arenicorallina]OAA29769.1 peptidyl-tRNA hydrolase [Kosmotoga arenicorallina S304]